MPNGPLKIVQFVRGSERYGASVSIKNLCWGLRARGHEVVLFTYRGRTLGSSMSEAFRMVELEPHSKFDIRSILRLRELFVREKPDVIHTHLSAATLSGTVAARLAHIPVVATVHGMNQRWTYSFADHIITVSEAGKRNLVRQGVRGSDISVAYNGIQMPSAEMVTARSAMRESLGINRDALVLGSISRADYGKGIQDAISAVAMLKRRFKGLRYFFAGDGEYLEELKTQTKALGLSDHVSFLGFRDDVFDLLSAMDLFVFPSLKEAMGISIVEAMAMGLPVVGTRVGGIPEVVTAETGVLVPPNAPPALANACVPLLENAELRLWLGENARARARGCFSVKASADAVEAAYRKIVKS